MSQPRSYPEDRGPFTPTEGNVDGDDTGLLPESTPDAEHEREADPLEQGDEMNIDPDMSPE